MNNIIVISGPSGSGKGTVAHQLIKRLASRLIWSKTATTRPIRNDDIDLSRRIFLNETDFFKAVRSGDIIEHIKYNDHYYGTLRSELEKILSTNANALLEIDIDGALKIKDLYGEKAKLIFLKVPISQLRSRLEARGMAEKDIKTRLLIAEEEFTKSDKCDLIVDNIDNQLEDTVEQITNYLKKL